MLKNILFKTSVLLICLITLNLISLPVKAIIGNNFGSVTSSYEISSFTIDGDYIDIKGWHYPDYLQNIYSQTLTQKMHIGGKSYADQNDYWVDHTSTAQTSGLGWCPDNAGSNQQGRCNYYFQDVGFHFRIPVSDLTNDIELYPQIAFSIAGKGEHRQGFKTSLDKEILETKEKNYQIRFSSSLNSNRLQFRGPNNMFVRNGPGKAYGILNLNGQQMYWRPNDRFKVYDAVQGEGEQMWYKVMVGWYGANKVSESTTSGIYGWIPSGVVYLEGQETNILINKRPIINAEDQTIYDGQEVDLMKNVSAIDREDGNITPNIKVSGTVNNKVPGKYPITYTVTDSGGMDTKKTVIITVLFNSPPAIQAEDRWFYETDDITDQELLRKVVASDKEDGDISSNAFITSSNVQPHVVGDYNVSYKVVDSYGKSAETSAKVLIVGADTTPPTNKYVRHISKKYIKTLKPNSKWRTNPALWAELNETLNKEPTDANSIQIWNFKYEDIKKVQEHNEQYGFGTEANKKFLEDFNYCRTK